MSFVGESKHIMDQFMDVLWSLHEVSPVNKFISCAVSSGLPHTESVVFCMVEIIHAFMLNESSLVSNIKAYFSY